LIRQLRHYFRFAIEFLLSSRLIDNKGKPLGLSGLVGHLHYHEPANFALLKLLESGVIPEICRSFQHVDKQTKEIIARDLLFVLAHLFNVVYIPVHKTRKDYPRSTSCVILDPLPENMETVLRQHRALTLDVFTSYCRVYAITQLRLEQKERNQLPYSSIQFNYNPINSENSKVKRTLVSNICASTLSYEARSPFVALSGHDDQFHSAHQLANTVRNGIDIETSYLPSCESLVDSSGTNLKKNAYVLDFYKHGQYETIVADNGLVEGQLWNLFKDWSEILKTMAVAFEKQSEYPERDNIVLAFKYLADNFNDQFGKINTQVKTKQKVDKLQHQHQHQQQQQQQQRPRHKTTEEEEVEQLMKLHHL